MNLIRLDVAMPRAFTQRWRVSIFAAAAAAAWPPLGSRRPKYSN